MFDIVVYEMMNHLTELLKWTSQMRLGSNCSTVSKLNASSYIYESELWLSSQFCDGSHGLSSPSIERKRATLSFIASSRVWRRC